MVIGPDTRELPLEQRPNLHQAGDPIEKLTDLLKHGYIIMEPTTVGSLWLENDQHENELEF